MIKNNGDVALSELHLPQALIRAYSHIHVFTLFGWQAECINMGSCWKHLVYSGPTSSGKTIVAEIIVYKCLRNATKGERAKAIFVLPFISDARQKLHRLQRLFTDQFRLEGFFGSSGNTSFDDWDIAVCTIEKGASLINRLIEQGEINSLGVLVVDELHLAGDDSRGSLIEGMITKLLYLNKKLSDCDVKIIGMSATLPNATDFAKWLHTEFFETTYRPVPLIETVKYKSSLIAVKTDGLDEQIRDVTNTEFQVPNDEDYLIGFTLETVCTGCGVLIFSQTKKQCEQIANNIATAIHSVLSKKQGSDNLLKKLATILEYGEQCGGIRKFLREYKCVIKSVDPHLLKMMKCGVAFHHAGLTLEEREMIESGYRKGNIKVIVATATLSSGVNLPAQRVIIRHPWTSTSGFGPHLSLTSYKQMIGRAGRKGIDDRGESILICRKSQEDADFARCKEILLGEMTPISSSLLPSDWRNKRHEEIEPTEAIHKLILEVICNGMATSKKDLLEYLDMTLMAAQIRRSTFHERRFIMQRKDITGPEKEVEPSQLGSATLASSLCPEEAEHLFDSLQMARRTGIILEGELHLIYLITPIYCVNRLWSSQQQHWSGLLKKWNRLPDHMKLVARNAGIADVAQFCRSKITSSARQGKKADSLLEKDLVYKRFYASLILHELIQEVPIDKVAAEYECDRGSCQSLQQSASMYAGMAVAFCDRLGWVYLKGLLSGMAERLMFGVKRELTDLIRIDGLDGMRARVFHNEGFTTTAKLALSNVCDVIRVLRKAVPFEHSSSRNAWLHGYPDINLTTAAETLQRQASELLQENLYSLGLENVVPIRDPADRERLKSNDTIATHGEVIIHTEGTKKGPDVNCAPAHTDLVSDVVQRLESVSVSADEHIANKENKSGKKSSTLSDSQSDMESGKGSLTHTPLKARNMSKVESDKQTDLEEVVEDCSLSDSILLAVGLEADEQIQTTDKSKEGDSSHVSKDSGIDSQSVLGLEMGLSDCSNVEETLSDSVLLAAVLNAEANAHKSDECEPGPSSSPSDAIRQRFDRDQMITQGLEYGWTGTSSKSNSSPGDVICPSPEASTAIDMTKRSRGFKQISNTPSPGIKKRPKLSHGDKRRGSDVAPVQSGSTENRRFRFVCVDTRNVENVFADLTSARIVSIVATRKSLVADQKDKAVVDKFVSFIKDDRITKVVFDAKDFLKGLKDVVSLPGDVRGLFCCSTAHWLSSYSTFTDNSSPKAMATRTLNHSVLSEISKDVSTCLSKESQQIQQMSSESIQLYHIHKALYRSLAVKSLISVFEEQESPALPVIAQIEAVGPLLDTNALRSQVELLLRIKAKLEKEAHRLAGHQFQLSKSSEVAKVLFDEIQLIPGYDIGSRQVIAQSKASKPKRHYSTAQESLELMAAEHPLPRVVLDWRKIEHSLAFLRKLASTYNIGLDEPPEIDQRRFVSLHSDYKMTTATGRMIMNDPSLQNTPKSIEVTSLNSNADDESSVVVSLRSMLVASEGCVLLAADYCQLELRILAHLCADVELIRSFSHSSHDIFTVIASSWLHVPVDKVSKVKRQQTKQLCYGIVYGMGAKSLSSKLKVCETEAKELLQQFNAKFSGIARWIGTCKGGVLAETISGRKRKIDDVNCDFELQSEAERKRINTRVQGSAADIFKVAVIRIARRLKDFPGSRIVLLLHDEIVVDAPEKFSKDIIAIIKKEMEGSWKLAVPLNVKIQIGYNWANMKDV